MKIATKLILFGMTGLALLVSVIVVSRLFPDWLSGVQEPFIIFFLGYCGIIIVAQTFAFVETIRRRREKTGEEGRPSHAGIESA